jgi:hypothetical protein
MTALLWREIWLRCMTALPLHEIWSIWLHFHYLRFDWDLLQETWDVWLHFCYMRFDWDVWLHFRYMRFDLHEWDLICMTSFPFDEIWSAWLHFRFMRFDLYDFTSVTWDLICMTPLPLQIERCEQLHSTIPSQTTDVFMLCFAVDNRQSFHTLTHKWLPQLKASFPFVPTVLVACKTGKHFKSLIIYPACSQTPWGSGLELVLYAPCFSQRRICLCFLYDCDAIEQPLGRVCKAEVTCNSKCRMN